MRYSIIATALMLSVLLCSIAFAADTYDDYYYGFTHIAETGDREDIEVVNGDIGEAQLSFVVSYKGQDDEGNDLVAFTFDNTGENACSITAIYFDDDVPLLAFASDAGNGSGFDYSADYDKDTQTGVAFSEDANPGDLPGGGDPLIAFSSDYDYDADPSKHKGVDPGEWVKLYFTLTEGYDYDGLIAALDNTTFRVGIHVQGFLLGPDGSEAFVNSTPGEPIGSGGGGGAAVPEPGTLLLLGFGMLGAAGISRKKISKNVFPKESS